MTLAIAVLTTDEARSLTDQIKAHVTELLPLIKEAFERRADVALGYENWLTYCDTELRGLRLPVDLRREAVAELREAGMSTRAIGAALGVDQSTVVRDLRPTDASASVAQPEKVVSLDGRERPATRPTVDPIPPAIAEQIEQRIAEKFAPVVDSPASEPERPKPPAWDPQERDQHERDVLRTKDIQAARRQAKTLVPDVRALVFTVLQGSRQGEKGLVTRDMIADLRKAIDLLEGEINDEK